MIAAPSISTFSAAVLGRCKPVATMIKISSRDSALLQRYQQRLENQPVRHGTGDVADGDARAASSPRQVSQGRSALRLGQSPADRGSGVRNRLDRLITETFYQVLVRQINDQARPAILETHTHFKNSHPFASP